MPAQCKCWRQLGRSSLCSCSLSFQSLYAISIQSSSQSPEVPEYLLPTSGIILEHSPTHDGAALGRYCTSPCLKDALHPNEHFTCAMDGRQLFRTLSSCICPFRRLSQHLTARMYKAEQSSAVHAPTGKCQGSNKGAKKIQWHLTDD